MLITSIFILFSFFSTNLHFNVVEASGINGGENPFSPKAYIQRYWQQHISNGLPAPKFLLHDKASQLTAVETATFTKLAEQNILFAHLPSFCSAANLFCFPSGDQKVNGDDSPASFDTYVEDRNFTNYDTPIEGTNEFNNYSPDGNVVSNNFRRYSRGGSTTLDKFTNYANDSNAVNQNFASYDVGGVVSAGEFINYNPNVNVPDLTFTSYSTDTFGDKQSFTSYTENANSGNEIFTNYGRKSTASTDEFTSYANNSNVITSSFSSYGQLATGPNETFTSYGSNTNNPQNDFKSYGDGGFLTSNTFKNYRDDANVGDDSFQSYAKHSEEGAGSIAKFSNYGQSANIGSDTFKGYGKDSPPGLSNVDFTIYGVNTTFKDYSKDGVSFSKYNQTLPESVKSKLVNKWRVEPGKFFREKMLKIGTVMPMPDISDKMPKRSFLPRVILGKIPSTSSKIEELKKIFQAGKNSSMAEIISSALSECERAPSPGETKRCVGSIEDMIDFATTVLGRNIVPKTTESTKGSKGEVMIGSIKKINGGKITKSVSCHQVLYPYLMYYCHSVPKVRIYEANLMDPKSKAKMNGGVAICHMDTSVWSANHGAFVALGPGPGKIEVCHWIFENDLTWVIAD